MLKDAFSKIKKPTEQRRLAPSERPEPQRAKPKEDENLSVDPAKEPEDETAVLGNDENEEDGVKENLFTIFDEEDDEA